MFAREDKPFDSDDAGKAWKVIENSIHEIYNDNIKRLNFAELYRTAYEMVLHKHGEKLYNGIVDTMTGHLKDIADSIEAAEGVQFLEELNRQWIEHIKATRSIRDVVMYMDRSFVEFERKTPVRELGLNLWVDVVVLRTEVQTRLLQTMLELVHTERNGEVIDRGLMRNTTKMLSDLGTAYRDDFEDDFLHASIIFYRDESRRLIECCDCGQYLEKVERRLNEETERVSHYLCPGIETKLRNVVEKEMIAKPMQRLVHMENYGLVNLLIDDKYEDLGRMYCLFQRVTGGLTTIRDVMTSHIRETGKHLVLDPENIKDPVNLVQRLLDERDKHEKIISQAFNKDTTFRNALDSSFEYFINLNNRTPEFISLYVDDKLQRGFSEDDVEVIMDKVVMLYRWLQKKEVFEKFYEKHLTKRLVSELTFFEDNEMILIAKLSKECGHQFTSKLEGTTQQFYAIQEIDAWEER